MNVQPLDLSQLRVLPLAERRSLLGDPGFRAYLAARLAGASPLAPTPERASRMKRDSWRIRP